MKYIFKLMLLIISIKSYTQTHKAIYSFKVEKNPITGSVDFADEVNKFSEQNKFYLYFNNENSYFTSENFEIGVPDLSDAIAGTYYPIKYNLSKKNFYYNDNLDNLYCIDDNYIPFWTITTESKIISGLECFKAIGVLKKGGSTQINLEAWFTPEIPYPTGPKYVVDLPGLVVYLVDREQFIFKLESIELNSKSLNPTDKKIEGEVINYEKYIELLKSFD